MIVETLYRAPSLRAATLIAGILLTLLFFHADNDSGDEDNGNMTDGATEMIRIIL